MKIALANSNLTLKGGAERVILKIAQHYKAPIYVAEFDEKSTFEEFSGMDIRVITQGKASSMLPYGRAAQGLDYGLSFYGLQLGDQFDVINAHMAPSHWIKNKNPRVLWYCHTPLRDVYDLYHYRMSMRRWYTRPIYMAGIAAVKSIDQRMVRKIKHIVTNSHNTNSRIKRYYHRHDAKVLGGGIDVKEYSNKGDGKYFLYPSRISPNKRQRFAVEAFREFSRQVKGYSLVIAGAVSNDPFYKNYYDEVARQAGYVGHVRFVKNPSESKLKELYSRCTAVLYPPLNEDYGLVPLEAMASAKPVIAVNDGGPKETVEHNKTGLLIHDEHEMAKAMGLLAKDGELSAQMGRAGREAAEKKYSWEHFFREFDKCLRAASKE